MFEEQMSAVCRGSLLGQWAGRGQALGQAWGRFRGSWGKKRREQAQTIYPEAAFLHLALQYCQCIGMTRS